MKNGKEQHSMKKNFMFIILGSAILGILIGTVLKDYNKKDIQHTYKETLIKKEIKTHKNSIKDLKKEKESLEKQINDLKNDDKNYESKEDENKLENLKENLAYTDIKGNGIVINIDAVDDSIGNIADIIESNKILINIVNDLKKNGGKYISINNERINQYSQIVLAGNHINIGSVPIAPPYKIECIGNKKQLINYAQKENGYLDGIVHNYPLNIASKIQENINLEKVKIPNE